MTNEPLLISGKKGFSLVEIVVSIGILSFVSFGLISFFTNIQSSVQSESLKAVRNVENIEFSKLLSQPVYLASLAEYPENSQLKECMELDNKKCQSSVDYTLTPFDLKNNQKLKMASLYTTDAVVSDLKFKVHCPSDATECDKADYYIISIKTSSKFAGIPLASVEKKITVIPEIKKVQNKVPDGMLTDGSPINIVLLLDTSNSLASVKDKIKDSLDNLISRIGKLNATVSIFPLTDALNGYRREVFRINDDGSLTQEANKNVFAIDEVYAYREYRKYNFEGVFTTGNPIAVKNTGTFYKTVKFSKDDLDSVKADKIQALKYLVDNYLNNNFNWPDSTMCNIINLIQDTQVNPSIKIDSNVPTVMMVLTNEDDETNNCLKLLKGTGVRKPDYIGNNIMIRKLKINYTMNILLDGIPKEVPFDYYADFPYSETQVFGTDCMADVPLADLSRVLLYAQGSGYINDGSLAMKSCVYSAYSRTVPNTLNDPSLCDKINSKQPGYEQGNTFIDGSCTSYSIIHEEFVGTGQENYLTTSQEAIQVTYDIIKAKTNLKNFYFVPIIHPDAVTCPLTNGAKVGTKYTQLASMPGMNSTVIPICSESYTAGVDQIINWTKSLASNNITLDQATALTFKSLEIIRSGSTINVVKDVDYQLVDTVLVFKAGVLNANDVVRVYTK